MNKDSPFGFRMSPMKEEFTSALRKDKTQDTRDEMKRVTFSETIARFDVRESDAEKQGLFALALLMKGNFVIQLTQLLEESDTPVSVKLIICEFLLDGDFADAGCAVEKTLMEVCHIGRKEWHSNMKKKSTTLRDTI